MRWVLVVAVLALVGCASDGALEGDCNASVRYEGNLYRVHSAMPGQAPLGRVVGSGEVVGCGGLDAPAVDRVDVRRIKGVDPEAAIGTRGNWEGVFIRDDLASEPSSWPEPLRP
ncbi:hypothetical protein [Nocardioides sp. SYSU DS0663]|uniref:hypothetical protein n=1 Tax=Nocardioides sp. SYSU DS0663 TaxID=3416445 RepID=UPI003F4C4C7E